MNGFLTRQRNQKEFLPLSQHASCVFICLLFLFYGLRKKGFLVAKQKEIH